MQRVQEGDYSGGVQEINPKLLDLFKKKKKSPKRGRVKGWDSVGKLGRLLKRREGHASANSRRRASRSGEIPY